MEREDVSFSRVFRLTLVALIAATLAIAPSALAEDGSDRTRDAKDGSDAKASSDLLPATPDSERVLDPEAESDANTKAAQPKDDSSAGKGADTPESDKRKDENGPTALNIFDQAIRRAQDRCVKIYGVGIAREHGYATGLVVSNDGLILTAFGLYVTGRIRVVLPDGSVHEAEVERRSDRIQCVLLRIKAKTSDYFELPTEPIVGKGDWVLAVGNPYNVAARQEPLSVNLGVVSLRSLVDTKKKAQDVDIDAEVLLIDAITSNAGAPGGALITVDGRLAGMVGKIIESETTNTRLNYALPSDVLRQFVDGTLKEKDDDGSSETVNVELGIRLFRLAGDKAAVYIDRVKRGSPAHKARLRKDDQIMAIGGFSVYSIEGYDEVLKTLKPGEPVKIYIKRKNQTLLVELTPEKLEKND